MAYSRRYHGVIGGIASFALLVCSFFIPVSVAYSEPIHSLRSYQVTFELAHRDYIVAPLPEVAKAVTPNPERHEYKINPSKPEYMLAMITGHAPPFDAAVDYPKRE